MNTSEATAESSEDYDKCKSNDEPSPDPGDVEVPLLVSISQASPRHNTTGGDGRLPLNDDNGMKQIKLDDVPSWRGSLPVIALKPRVKIPGNVGGSRRPAKSVKPELFVPSLKGLDENDFESSSPITFMRISEPMTVKRHSSLVTMTSSNSVQNRFAGSRSSCQNNFPHVLSRSSGSKRSLSESSPFLSINESSNFSPEAKKPIVVEKN